MPPTLRHRNLLRRCYTAYPVHSLSSSVTRFDHLLLMPPALRHCTDLQPRLRLLGGRIACADYFNVVGNLRQFGHVGGGKDD